MQKLFTVLNMKGSAIKHTQDNSFIMEELHVSYHHDCSKA